MSETEYMANVDFEYLVLYGVVGMFFYDEIADVFPNCILEEDTMKELRIIPKSEEVVRVQFPKRYAFFNPVMIRIVKEEFEITHWQLLRTTKQTNRTSALVGHIKDNDCLIVICPKGNPRFWG